MTNFQLADSQVTIHVDVRQLIIAGWAGRVQSAIDEHIEELKEIGVTPPSTTPLFYRVAANQLTTAPDIQVLGEASSGEVEVVLIGSEQGTLVASVRIILTARPRPGPWPTRNRSASNR